MRLRKKVLTGLIGISMLAFQGCKPRTFGDGAEVESKSTNALAAEKPATMCLSVMGNGGNFPSHIGAMIALLERNVLPVASSGSSSASITAPILRAILTNPSLAGAEVYSADGRKLSIPQKAALVLAAAMKVFDSMLFLPKLRNFIDSLSDAKHTLDVNAKADAFLGNPDIGFTNAEVIVAQSLVALDFFMNVDLSHMLRKKTILERANTLFSQWVKDADLLLVTPGQFVNAVFRPQSKNDTDLTKEIRSRYREVFLSDYSLSAQAHANQQKKFNNLLSLFSLHLKLVPEAALTEAFVKSMKQFGSVPFVGVAGLSMSYPFYLPSPKRLREGYFGRRANGSVLPFPRATFIHTTARVADKNESGAYVEREGWQFFYQAYYPSPDIAKDLVTSYNTLPEGRSFLEFPNKNGKYEVLLPKNRLLVLTDKRISDAVRYSSTEPNLFSRSPLLINDEDEKRHRLQIGKGELITYGGWLEAVSSRTLERLSVCNDVDYMGYIAVRPYVNDFQRAAMRAVIEPDNAYTNRTEVIERGKIPEPNTPYGVIYNRLGEFIRYAQQTKGKKGRVVLDWDWEDPSDLTGPNRAAMSLAIQNNRPALAMAAYQDMRVAMKRDQINQEPPKGFEPFGDISGLRFDKATSPESLYYQVKHVFGE